MTAQQIRCPHCGQIFVTPPGSAGQIVACPHCQGQLRMPAAAPPQTAAAARPAASPPARPPAAAPAAYAAARPAPAPARPPAPTAPKIETHASSAAPMIHDPTQATATGRIMHRRKSNNNLVLYIAIPITLLFVVGAIGVIAVVSNRKSGDKEAEEITDQLIEEFEGIVVALESVKDEASAKRAARQIELSADRIKELAERADKIKVSKSKDKELQRKVKARLETLGPRLQSAAMKAGAASKGHPALGDALKKFAELEKLAV